MHSVLAITELLHAIVEHCDIVIQSGPKRGLPSPELSRLAQTSRLFTQVALDRLYEETVFTNKLLYRLVWSTFPKGALKCPNDRQEALNAQHLGCGANGRHKCEPKITSSIDQHGNWDYFLKLYGRRIHHWSYTVRGGASIPDECTALIVLAGISQAGFRQGGAPVLPNLRSCAFRATRPSSWLTLRHFFPAGSRTSLKSFNISYSNPCFPQGALLLQHLTDACEAGSQFGLNLESFELYHDMFTPPDLKAALGVQLLGFLQTQNSLRSVSLEHITPLLWRYVAGMATLRTVRTEPSSFFALGKNTAVIINNVTKLVVWSVAPTGMGNGSRTPNLVSGVTFNALTSLSITGWIDLISLISASKYSPLAKVTLSNLDERPGRYPSWSALLSELHSHTTVDSLLELRISEPSSRHSTQTASAGSSANVLEDIQPSFLFPHLTRLSIDLRDGLDIDDAGLRILADSLQGLEALFLSAPRLYGQQRQPLDPKATLLGLAQLSRCSFLIEATIPFRPILQGNSPAVLPPPSSRMRFLNTGTPQSSSRFRNPFNPPERGLNVEETTRFLLSVFPRLHLVSLATHGGWGEVNNKLHAVQRGEGCECSWCRVDYNQVNLKSYSSLFCFD
ncbi:hypothetical protein DL96DRAFT_1621415 [Flagelloscypha sp. PMI_526]|nr:hypothetical protein DL96DRAFT_1621415 [Flagelloscypha sp. PMI_526]